MKTKLEWYLLIRKMAIRNGPYLQRFFKKYHEHVMAIDTNRFSNIVAMYPSHRRIIAYQKANK